MIREPTSPNNGGGTLERAGPVRNATMLVYFLLLPLYFEKKPSHILFMLTSHHARELDILTPFSSLTCDPLMHAPSWTVFTT
jgi:hypothetical protein